MKSRLRQGNIKIQSKKHKGQEEAKMEQEREMVKFEI